MRGGAVAARRAHNPKVAGSSPAPATERQSKTAGLLKTGQPGGLWFTEPPPSMLSFMSQRPSGLGVAKALTGVLQYKSAEVIAELLKLAKEMPEAGRRGERLNLNEDKIAFYAALEVNDSAVKVLGDETLKGIARELVETARKKVTV